MDKYLKQIADIIINLPNVKKLNDKTPLNAYIEDYVKEKYCGDLSYLDNNPIDAVNKLMKRLTTDEKILFSGLPENEIKGYLIPDPAISELYAVAWKIFDLAKDCKLNDYKLNDEDEYKNWLGKLNKSLSKIQEFNMSCAKEFAEEAILDLNYAFGKSSIMSIDLQQI